LVEETAEGDGEVRIAAQHWAEPRDFEVLGDGLEKRVGAVG